MSTAGLHPSILANFRPPAARSALPRRQAVKCLALLNHEWSLSLSPELWTGERVS